MNIKDFLELAKDPYIKKDFECLQNLRNYVCNASSTEQKYERMREFLMVAKEMTMRPIYHEKDGVAFLPLASFIESTAESLPYEPLLETHKIEIREQLTVPSQSSCPEERLEFIVGHARYILNMRMNLEQGLDRFENYDLANKCLDAASLVYDLATSLKIKGELKTVEPGYLLDNSLYENRGGGCHAFTILYFSDRAFLVDCTYSQFFAPKRCIIDKTGIIRVRNCDAGFFMLQNEERKKVAREILERGWIELKGDVLKHYLDGFSLSFRNGLYYEYTKDFSYTTPYTVEDYKQFLSYQDSQVEHEGEKVLGYMYKPLKNPKMKFRR
ncbi:MAG TPA: hypothetical protein DCY94_00605 [Firmicutes bacterium]|nr:hypothetical protein [Bacillota bacterium]